jgi:hypothetical protein
VAQFYLAAKRRKRRKNEGKINYPQIAPICADSGNGLRKPFAGLVAISENPGHPQARWLWFFEPGRNPGNTGIALETRLIND